MLAILRLLLAACWLLCGVWCSVFIGRCLALVVWLIVVRCLMFEFVVGVVCYWFRVDCCLLLFVDCCVLFVSFWLFVVDCLLVNCFCCLLFVVC